MQDEENPADLTQEYTSRYRVLSLHARTDSSEILLKIQKVLALDGFRNPLIKCLDQRLLFHYFDCYFAPSKPKQETKYQEPFVAQVGMATQKPMAQIVKNLLRADNRSAEVVEEILEVGLEKLLETFREFEIDAAIAHARIVVATILEAAKAKEEKILNKSGIPEKEEAKYMAYDLNRDVYEAVFRMLLTGGHLPALLAEQTQEQESRKQRPSSRTRSNNITTKLSFIMDTEESRYKEGREKETTAQLQLKVRRFAMRKEPVNGSLSQMVSTPSQIEKRREGIRVRTIRLIRKKILTRVEHLKLVLQKLCDGEHFSAMNSPRMATRESRPTSLFRGKVSSSFINLTPIGITANEGEETSEVKITDAPKSLGSSATNVLSSQRLTHNRQGQGSGETNMNRLKAILDEKFQPKSLRSKGSAIPSFSKISRPQTGMSTKLTLSTKEIRIEQARDRSSDSQSSNTLADIEQSNRDQWRVRALSNRAKNRPFSILTSGSSEQVARPVSSSRMWNTPTAEGVFSAGHTGRSSIEHKQNSPDRKIKLRFEDKLKADIGSIMAQLDDNLGTRDRFRQSLVRAHKSIRTEHRDATVRRKIYEEYSDFDHRFPKDSRVFQYYHKKASSENTAIKAEIQSVKQKVLDGLWLSVKRKHNPAQNDPLLVSVEKRKNDLVKLARKADDLITEAFSML